jgi:hypothetical protein
MASAELSGRVERVVGYPPLSELSDDQRREFHEALLDADSSEDLPGKWQAAIFKAEQKWPRLRVVSAPRRPRVAASHWLISPSHDKSQRSARLARPCDPPQ